MAANSEDDFGEEEELFEVDHIVSCRVDTNGDISYLVRWKGYSTDDDTWEPEENLQSCKDAILKFFNDRDVKPTKTGDFMKLNLKKPSPAAFRYESSSEDDNEIDENEPNRKSIKKEFQTKVNESPFSGRNLRLTPERKMHLVNNDKRNRGREPVKEKSIENNKPRIRARKRVPLEKDEKSPWRSTSKNTNNEKAKSEISDTFYESEVDQGNTMETTSKGKFRQFFLPIILTAVFSICLIGIFYAILMYDLS